jgi:hypothetical protein
MLGTELHPQFPDVFQSKNITLSNKTEPPGRCASLLMCGPFPHPVLLFARLTYLSLTKRPFYHCAEAVNQITGFRFTQLDFTTIV